jgi:predicted heme/steroid binding protein
MKKRFLFPILMIVVVLLISACSPSKPAVNDTKDTTDQETTEMMELTLEQLAKYNGKDGQPAYIAVDGVIYDVSNHPAWKNGGHNGYEAGKDLTEQIKNISPHGVSKLADVPEVGKLVP